jgi:hypothetical protein
MDKGRTIFLILFLILAVLISCVELDSPEKVDFLEKEETGFLEKLRGGVKPKSLCKFIYAMNVGPGEYPRWDAKLDEKIKKLIEDLDELGINGVGFWIPGARKFDKKLRREDITDEVIDEYMKNLELSDWDKFIDALLETGRILLGKVSHGYTGSLPCFQQTECPFEIEPTFESNPKNLPKRYLPDVVGKEYYLGWAYLNTRAIVRRYKGKMRVWQVENEVNVTCETILFGWRHGSAWCDREFVKELIKTIAEGIIREDPEALLAINFHTDLPHHMSLTDEWISGGNYLDDIRDFWDWIDVIGIDFYPNYMAVAPIGGNKDLTDPQLAWNFLGRVEAVREVMDEIGDEKPIIIMETGYPSAPEDLGFSEEKQSRFLENIFSAAISAGIFGLWYFKLTSSEVANPEAPDYQRVEGYWGFYRADMSRKPIFFALKNLEKP